MHSPELGDYIGGESCIDLRTDVTDIFPWCGGAAAAEPNHHRRRPLRRYVSDTPAEKEYPPPIPLLVRSENLPPPHIPWVMTRHYSGDGRLVITEEKPRRHEFFQSHRSDGRLVISLVALENDDESWEEQCPAGEGKEELEINADGGEVDGAPAAEEALPAECYTYNGIGGNNPAYEVAAAATAAF